MDKDTAYVKENYPVQYEHLRELVKLGVLTEGKASQAIANIFYTRSDKNRKVLLDRIDALWKEATEKPVEEEKKTPESHGYTIKDKFRYSLSHRSTIPKEERAEILAEYDAAKKAGDTATIEDIKRRYSTTREVVNEETPFNERIEPIEEEMEASEPVEEEETRKLPPLEYRVNGFANLCNTMFGSKGARHEDIRSKTSGFYIEKNGEPLAIRGTKNVGIAYEELLARYPDDSITLVCGFFPGPKYKEDREEYIARLMKEIRDFSEKQGVSLPEESMRYLRKGASDIVKKDLMFEYPDYGRIFFKKNKDNDKGMVWVELSSYRPEEVPEPGRGIKPLDFTRIVLNDMELNAVSEPVWGYDVPYSSKTHRYPLEAMCLVDEDTKVCISEEHTVFVEKGKKEVIKW